MKDVLVVGLNPAFQTTLHFEHFKQGQVNRAYRKCHSVLEHASTKAAVDLVKSFGDTVGCTITIHHLVLTVDDWAGQCHHFCKPVAKFPHDREALRDVILQGNFQARVIFFFDVIHPQLLQQVIS